MNTGSDTESGVNSLVVEYECYNLSLIWSWRCIFIGTLIYALFYNSISDGKKSSQRMKSLQADKSTKKANQVKRVDDKQRRRARENTLKNVEDQRAAGKKAASPSLTMRMTQAGMTMTIKEIFYDLHYRVFRYPVYHIAYCPIALVHRDWCGNNGWFWHSLLGCQFQAKTAVQRPSPRFFQTPLMLLYAVFAPAFR